MTREEFIDHFGMTPEKAKELMERLRELINREVYETIAHADYYINPRAYGYEGPLEKEDFDDDGFVCMYEYGRFNSAEKTFMDFISWHSRHGGHTSAIRACELMGIDWEETND